MKANEILMQCNKNLSSKESGVYMILCIPDGKVYVGSSKRIDARWSQHRRKLLVNNHANPILQSVYNKYGKESLHFQVLENCKNLFEREAQFLNMLDPELRMNLAPIHDKVEMSLDTRKRISKALKDGGIKPPSRVGCVPWNKGIPTTEDHRKKISEGKKKAMNESTKRKLAEAVIKQPRRKGVDGRFIKEGV